MLISFFKIFNVNLLIKPMLIELYLKYTSDSAQSKYSTNIEEGCLSCIQFDKKTTAVLPKGESSFEF